MTISQAILAARLKEARLASGCTQEQVAELLGILHTDVIQLETDERAVSTLELAKLAEIYHRSIVSFFEAEPESARRN